MLAGEHDKFTYAEDVDAMDSNQIPRMIEWLDEERRRDKNTIAKLEERLLQQQEFIDTLTRRLNGVESDQSLMRTAFLPAGRDNDIVTQLRTEIQQATEAVEAKRLAAERETERRQEASRENVTRPLRDLSDRIEKLERLADEMGAARVERDRFAAALQALQQRAEDLAKKLEDPERRLTFLEEQRRQDSRRISETQTELPELQRMIDSLKPKIDLIEEMALRNEKRVIEVQNAERDRREQIHEFVEQQTLFIQQRDQYVQELTHTFGQYDEEMRRNLERFESWSETYRQMKKVIEDFERIGDRLERRINEVAETQRLSEERFRQEWNSWNADDQKRWKQFTLTNDEAWRLHDKEFDQFRAKFNEMAQMFPPVHDSLDRLWKFQRAQVAMYREELTALMAEFDQAEEKTKIPSNGNGRRQ
jgi:chromosome segregation ATPase